MTGEPEERHWKEYAEQYDEAVSYAQHMAGGLLDCTCPSCGRHVGAFVVDGPDPVFADLVCPRDVCGHEWMERTA